MANITLSAGVRQNLLALQNTASLLGTTQNRLATGKKVNSALDNPSNFFTSVSLGARAGDLSNLLDSMSNGIKTLEAADNGLKAITRNVESMQSIVRQARQDKSQSVTAGTNTFSNLTNGSTATNNKISFDLGGGVSVAVDTYTQTVNATATTLTSVSGTFGTDLSAVAFSIDDDGAGAHTPVSVTFQAGSLTVAAKVDDINAALGAANSTVVAEVVGGQIKLSNATGADITVAGAGAATLGFGTGNTTSTNGTLEVAGSAKSVDDLVSAINASAALAGKVTASKDATNHLKLDNLTTSAITITGASSTQITGATTDTYSLAAGSVSTTSNVRQSLSNQFDDLKTQLDRLAADASFNGINLLAGDKLKLTFNETGSSSIDIQGKNADGSAFGAISSSTLAIDGSFDFSDDSDLDTLTTALSDALTSLRTQASQYGTSLTSVQNRQDFTKAMINTLQTGADNLVLADTNEEAANMLALQTRQQLSSTALSLASQADQQVLRLF
jgi:flagellin-like hook-associated protein FlgL